jgi:hypothetical protein
MTPGRLIPTVAFGAAAAALVFVAATAGGCSEAPATDPALSGQLTEMREAIGAMHASTENVATDVKRQSRRIEDLSRRVAELGGGRPDRVAVTAHAAPGASETTSEFGMAAASAPSGEELADEVATVLASKSGREAIAQAARGAVAESAARQRDGFVAYSLARFADEAKLSETQSKDVRKTWDDVMAKAREVMRDARPKPDMTPEERAESVTKIRTAMRDLGTMREERMRTILDDTQFELYKEREKEIDAGLHGAPPQRQSSGGTPPGEAGR